MCTGRWVDRVGCPKAIAVEAGVIGARDRVNRPIGVHSTNGVGILVRDVQIPLEVGHRDVRPESSACTAGPPSISGRQPLMPAPSIRAVPATVCKTSYEASKSANEMARHGAVQLNTIASTMLAT